MSDLLNSISILLLAGGVVYLLLQLRRTWSRLAKLEASPTVTIPAHECKSDDVTVLRSQLKNSAFRTERVRYIGGQRDGQSEWLETIPKEIRHPFRSEYWQWGHSIFELYRLIGPSPANPHIHLFEWVATQTTENGA